MAIDPDLFAAVVEALEAAAGEFESLTDGDMEWPIPADLQSLLDQREALLATLAKVCQGFEEKGKNAAAARVRAIYAAKLKTARGFYELRGSDGPQPLADVTSAVADALERVRRAALVDGDVRDALDSRVTSV